jgi:FkbM family methyltransferase
MKQILRNIRDFLYRFTKADIGGVSVKFYTPKSIDRSYIKIITGTEYYGEKVALEKFVSSLKEGHVVWDIGANIGSFTIPAAKKVGPYGQVVAFDLLNDNVARIRKNAYINKFENVQAVEVAMGNQNGADTMYFFPEADGRILDHVSSTLVKPSGSKFSQRQVTVARGDDLLSQYPAPHVVKIDVEGSEDDVILGMKQILSNPSCATVLCEVHPTLLQNTKPDEFKAMFASLGFTKIEKIPNKETFHLYCTK